MVYKLAAVAAVFAAGAVAECPNACSGHGECGNKDQCICYDGFFGGDCSMRVCPVGAAFVDAPLGDLNHDGVVGSAASAGSYSKVQWSRYTQYETWPSYSSVKYANGEVDASGSVGAWTAQSGEAHFMVECSGKGACDRQLGVCKCYDGYTGSSCQRTTCPNDCSGHGMCRTVGEIARSSGDKKFVDSVAGVNVFTGITAAYEYRLWDADKNAACVCDAGYSGIDCSLRECPRGDDPLTALPSTCGGGACKDEVQSFSVDGGQAAGSYNLRFTDFNGVSYVTAPFTLVTDATAATHQAANEAAVKAALEALPNSVTGVVSVSSAKPNPGGVFAGGASASSQLRFSVTFVGKSGNVNEMSLLPASASSGQSYLFQPSQPVQTFTLKKPASNTGTVQLTVYPVDQTLYGLSEYWVSDSYTIDFSVVTSANARTLIGDPIAKALNSIPAVKFAYGAPFVADSNVLVVADASLQEFTVTIAFPSKQLGANTISYTFAGATSQATPLNDVVDGTKEASICSNRGLCDYVTGVCKCFVGSTGNACETQSALARGSAAASN